MSNMRLTVGRVGEYEWMTLLAVDTQIFLLLEAVPDLVMGHLVAITSFDSGPLTPSEEECQLGWQRIGNILWTTPVTDPSLLPAEGYDEWYVCDSMINLSGIEVFVNYGAWRLTASALDVAEVMNANPTWDRRALEVEVASQLELVDRFWTQIQSVRPITFVAQGDNFNLATRDSAVFEKARRWATKWLGDSQPRYSMWPRR